MSSSTSAVVIHSKRKTTGGLTAMRPTKMTTARSGSTLLACWSIYSCRATGTYLRSNICENTPKQQLGTAFWGNSLMREIHVQICAFSGIPVSKRLSKNRLIVPEYVTTATTHWARNPCFFFFSCLCIHAMLYSHNSSGTSGYSWPTRSTFPLTQSLTTSFLQLQRPQLQTARYTHGPTDCWPHGWPGLTDNNLGSKSLHFQYGWLVSYVYSSLSSVWHESKYFCEVVAHRQTCKSVKPGREWRQMYVGLSNDM
jgi:hypothetical protein